MAKTYEIHYSTKNWYEGKPASMALAETDLYYAGQKLSGTIYGIHCLFDGLKNISPSSVQSIAIYVQRITGGSNITYSVNLAHSVLSGTIGDTIDVRSNASPTIFYQNRISWGWRGESTDTSGAYRSTTIDVLLFEALRDYGWFYTSDRSSSADTLNRYINVGDVYLVVETTETDYALIFDANGGTNTPAAQTLTGMDSATGTITMAVPVRDNHIFKGWAKSATATVAQYQPGDTITISANTTLYAVWAVSSVIRIMTEDGLKQGQVYVQTADGMKLGIVYVQTQNGLIQSN